MQQKWLLGAGGAIGLPRSAFSVGGLTPGTSQGVGYEEAVERAMDFVVERLNEEAGDGKDDL